MRYLIAAIMLYGCMSETFAADCESYSKSQYQAIRNAGMFKNSAVGYGGITPDEVLEFRCILKRHDARAIFDQLLNETTLSGKLYALSGLYITDKTYFENIIGKYRLNTTDVMTMYGCVIAPDKFSNVLKEIENGNLPQELAGH